MILYAIGLFKDGELVGYHHSSGSSWRGPTKLESAKLYARKGPCTQAINLHKNEYTRRGYTILREEFSLEPVQRVTLP